MFPTDDTGDTHVTAYMQAHYMLMSCNVCLNKKYVSYEGVTLQMLTHCTCANTGP